MNRSVISTSSNAFGLAIETPLIHFQKYLIMVLIKFWDITKILLSALKGRRAFPLNLFQSIFSFSTVLTLENIAKFGSTQYQVPDRTSAEQHSANTK